MPFDMDVFIRGHYKALPIEREHNNMFDLVRNAKFTRKKWFVNGIYYPSNKNGVNYDRIISRSGMKETRSLTFLPPRRYDNCADVSGYLAEQNAKPAVIHDGLSFVIKYKPRLIYGEMVIGFPGMTREPCKFDAHNCPYFPIIGISEQEIFMDEVPTILGWEAHWWVGAIPVYDPHFYPPPIYIQGNGIY